LLTFQEKNMHHDENGIISRKLPALLIGGPPNAGKSVLTYNLSQELRRLEIQHYVLRASPDGEGDWYNDDDNSILLQLRTDAHRKWTDAFRTLASRDINHRLLPLIVDLGGEPKEADSPIFQACTHSLLLLREDKEEATQTWRHFVSRHGLTELAKITSRLDDEPKITAREPKLTGVLAGLRRKHPIEGRIFGVLVNRICKLFGPYSQEPAEKEELEQFHLRGAKTERVVQLPTWLSKLAPEQDDWSPDQLQKMLRQISPQEPLSVYGRAPNWVYGALALHSEPNLPFFQFDPRYGGQLAGWLYPPTFQTSATLQADQPLVKLATRDNDSAWMLTTYLNTGYLDYNEADQILLPEPPSERGIIISGKLPLWLFTALARHYARHNPPWLALYYPHYPQEDQAIIISTRVPQPQVGERVQRPT
jgi:CRISPR-associated protein Csx3